MPNYSFTSKSYPFGTALGHGGVVPIAAPTKMLVKASWYVAPSERVKIEVWNGAISGATRIWTSVLDYGVESNGTPSAGNVNLIDTELDLGSAAPASLSAWETVIRVIITCSSEAVPDYDFSERVTVHCYKNLQTGRPELHFSPINLEQKIRPTSQPPIPRTNPTTSS